MMAATRRRSRGRWAALSAALLASGVCRPANADDYESVIARAVGARDHAVESGRAEDWQAALDLFASAITIRSTAEANFEWAGAADRLTFVDEAYAAYDEALRLGLSGRAGERARAFLSSHLAQVGWLAVAGPAGSSLYVGTRLRGVLPLAHPLIALQGLVHVRARHPMLPPWEATVFVEAGHTTPLEIVPIGAAPPLRTALPEPRRVEREPLRRLRHPPWGLPAVIGGGALAVAGAATVVITTILMNEEQRSLDRNCDVFQGSSCLYTTGDKLRAAQANVDRIATFDAVRGVAIGGAALGAVATVVGAWPSGGSGGATAATHTEIRLSRTEWMAEWRTTF